MKDKISFNDFLEIEKKLEIKMGTVVTVERIPKSDKMLKLSVNFGGDDIRIVMTNIGNRGDLTDDSVLEDEIVGLQCPFITNLEPVKIMGVESEAMIMLVDDGDLHLGRKGFPNGGILL